MTLPPRGYDLSLDRVTRLLETLANPQARLLKLLMKAPVESKPVEAEILPPVAAAPEARPSA